MLLSQITIKVDVHGQTKQVWFAFESDHSDLYDLNETLVEDGTIFGQRIETQPAGMGVRREISRYETILAKDAIVSITPLQFRLEPAGGATVERVRG